MTTLDADFDGAVRRISTTYDSLGRRASVVQYDAATSGSATDGVAISYDGWGNIAEYEEDRNSAVASGNDEYSIGYTWATGELGRNTVRKDVMTLPSGAALHHDYRSTAGRHDEDASRVTSLTHGTTLVATYQYNGVSQVVETDYMEADVRSQVQGASSGVYTCWDRYNRVVKSRWSSYKSTATDFYEIDLAYDRNSNITVIEDDVHTGFDVSYTMDDTDRLTRAEEGTWGGSSISSRSRDQQWTLDQVGNWNPVKLDLDGDGNFTGTDELDETRTHNEANEMTNRDPDSNPLNGSFTHLYDEVGNMTRNSTRTFVYDAFGRLRMVKKLGSGDLVAEYRYNGLRHLIGEHIDTDDDNDVDANDDWRFYAHDEHWRVVAYYVGSADPDDPTEEFVHHAAGLSGQGGSSYIDLVVLRDRDTNADGDLDDRMYYCQNWRADVSAIVDNAGEMYEWVKYSAYGVPIGLPGADTDSDGDCDSTDIAQIVTWKTSGYDVRGDVDLDGDVDDDDESIAQNRLEGLSLGRGVLSGTENWIGYAGYEWSQSVNLYHVRNRALSSNLGRWMQRDPLGYVDGNNQYGGLKQSPVSMRDIGGLMALPVADLLGAFKQFLGISAEEKKVLLDHIGDYEAIQENWQAIAKALRDLRAQGRLGPQSEDQPGTNSVTHCLVACMTCVAVSDHFATAFWNAHELGDDRNYEWQVKLQLKFHGIPIPGTEIARSGRLKGGVDVNDPNTWTKKSKDGKIKGVSDVGKDLHNNSEGGKCCKATLAGGLEAGGHTNCVDCCFQKYWWGELAESSTYRPVTRQPH